MLIIGYDDAIRARRPSGKKDDESPSNLTTEPRQNLELKENVAYITIHPKQYRLKTSIVPASASSASIAERAWFQNTQFTCSHVQ